MTLFWWRKRVIWWQPSQAPVLPPNDCLGPKSSTFSGFTFFASWAWPGRGLKIFADINCEWPLIELCATDGALLLSQRVGHEVNEIISPVEKDSINGISVEQSGHL